MVPNVQNDVVISKHLTGRKLKKKISSFRAKVIEKKVSFKLLNMQLKLLPTRVWALPLFSHFFIQNEFILTLFFVQYYDYVYTIINKSFYNSRWISKTCWHFLQSLPLRSVSKKGENKIYYLQNHQFFHFNSYWFEFD